MKDSTVRLWIFGDSWSALRASQDPERIWTRQLARRLSDHLQTPVQLRNSSLVGCAQDWITEQFLLNTAEMQAQDYVIIVLTSPQRYWFFKDKPDLTNWNIIDFDQWVTADQARAAEYYIKHIQRDEIDHLHMINRLGNIAYEAAARGLRRPLIIRGFAQDLGVAEHYPDLNIAQGFLTKIQAEEYADQQELERLYTSGGTNWFNGFDCRYNHLCLSNHDILVDKLLPALVKNKQPDLTQGFKTDLIAKNWYENLSFCDQELNPDYIKNFHEDIKNRDHSGRVWKIKTGINRILG